MSSTTDRLKDVRVPFTLLLALMSMGCTVPPPMVPMGGLENATPNEVSVVGRANGTDFNATLGSGSIIWLMDLDERLIEIDVFDERGHRVIQNYPVRSPRPEDCLARIRSERGRIEIEPPVARPPW